MTSASISPSARACGPDSSAVDGVRLRFDPLDDPMVKPTTLSLRLAGDGDYEGSGPNLRFDGRWKVTAIVALPDRVDSTQVSAQFAQGLLTITLPKAESAKPRHISVNASAGNSGPDHGPSKPRRRKTCNPP